MRDRDEEKRRLWNEVMNKKRDLSDEEVKLVLEPEDTKKDSSSSMTQSVLNAADSALDKLNDILKKQKEDLLAMNKELKEKKAKASIDADLEELNSSLEMDFGTKPEEKKPSVDVKEAFLKAKETLDTTYQKEELEQLMDAFKRPYVMGKPEVGPLNVILVRGPHGSGRHDAVQKIVSTLYNARVLQSKDVYTLDMSRYTNGSQEQIFLQDLYQALLGQGEVLCFENFGQSFPSFLNMISSLSTKGSFVLNKRYVLNKGILVENQTGLVTNSIASMECHNKFFIFITEGKESSVQDAFGAGFVQNILDKIVFNAFNEEEIEALLQQEQKDLIEECKERLQIEVSFSEEVLSWVKSSYDKTQGKDGVDSVFRDFFICLSQAKLQQDTLEKVQIVIEDNVPYGISGETKTVLTRVKSDKEELEAIEKELDGIVGLTEVKAYISSLQAHMQLNEKRRAQGLKVADVSKHMIFTGNPGTGKTTIARLLSRYMKAIHALSQGQLVEVTRADLVAQYVGQTAPLTMSVIKSAIGGVLFIDEAYSLYRGKEDSFGLEAIDTLVKAMEDNRDNLIVILAGYKKEMATFLEANSGLKSRFPNIIYFPDYTGEELVKIAQIQAKSKGYTISEEAMAPLQKYFEEVQATRASEAGNGRFARNVIEEAILKQAQRLLKEQDSPLDVLQLQDFSLQE